ncbi:MAG: class I SAM-dependent methyltransferase [Clostridia bacterium]|nr:class I SAM-dependent methyltransferase [Clostridia bacterium]
MMEYLKEYYESHDEDGRLISKHGKIEYITTMKYIHRYAMKTNAKRIVEIGAGTGRYSVALAKEGFDVTAVELVEHNLQILQSKLNGGEKLKAYQGNAVDLPDFEDGEFDMTLLLGPMYHLFTFEDKKKALGEAVRITKPGGSILVAYCMNEATVIQFAFLKNNVGYIEEKDLITPDWHCKSGPEELFDLVRTEDIEELDKTAPVTREKLIATDGAAHYIRAAIDAMDDHTYEKWIEYHLATCERQDIIGASNHTLDILIKNDVL